MKKITEDKNELDELFENNKDKKNALKKIVKKLEENENTNRKQ
ncbi:hypothetical protein [Marinirhabdus gelatinilytica]|uniref:Uncharacterized protein n=1 Tax=Marinirhabdus gelatinilytica TaxID=1703343 RepID=A0A370Q605_9FLAO|nr:hypothetical protein [Marinirhabdus gelatinilytica]RDK83794.1 hypothetical protein C8D94_1067 [Marinirhabdus gelatinilytica]